MWGKKNTTQFYFLWNITDSAVLFYFLCTLQVVLLKTALGSVKTPSTSFRAACDSWASTISWWTLLWCSKGCWEITATCRSTCVASSTGQSQQNPSRRSSIDSTTYTLLSCDKQSGNLSHKNTSVDLLVASRFSLDSFGDRCFVVVSQIFIDFCGFRFFLPTGKCIPGFGSNVVQDTKGCQQPLFFSLYCWR